MRLSCWLCQLLGPQSACLICINNPDTTCLHAVNKDKELLCSVQRAATFACYSVQEFLIIGFLSL